MALAAIAMTVVPSAHATPKTVAEFFGNPAGGASSLAGQFSGAQGVAVNSNPASEWFGDIYVVDQSNNRIQRFSSLGEFERMWGRDVIGAGSTMNADLGNVFEVCTHGPDCKAGVLGSLGGELASPRGIAVDQETGSVYVVEGTSSQAARVQKFTGDGEFVWALGKDVIANGSPSDPGGVTAAQVCTVAADCKSTPVGTQGGEFGRGGHNTGFFGAGGGNGIAVVPTPGPLDPPVLNAGNVVVTDRGNRRVQEFASSGAFVRAFGWDTVTDGSPSDPTSVGDFQICTVAADCKAGVSGSGPGQFGGTGDFENGPNRVAVDSTGRIYTVESAANFRVQRFTPQAGSPALGPSIILDGDGASDTPMDVAIGAADHVFVLQAFAAGAGTPPAEVAERRVVELDDTGALVETHVSRAGLGGPIDLALNIDNGKIYLTSARGTASEHQGVYIAGDWAQPIVSLGVNAVGSRAAELSGLVNPNGPGTPIGFHTQYRFEFRKAGDPTWIPASAERSAGVGFANVPVAETLEDLEADTDYEARLIARRPFSGLPATETAPVAFSTPPSPPDIDAVFVTDREDRSATLNATINPNGESTSYRFEYGTTAAYGTVVPSGAGGSAGDGTSPLTVSEAISGLAPETTYHYRVVASSANGTRTSADQTFTTRVATQAPDGRVYELVSPADKIGGSGVGPWYAGVGSHGNAGIAAYDGERFASLSYYGASLADGAFSYGADWTFGERTPAGWVNKPAFTRAGGQGQSEFAKIALIGAASDDLSLTAWDANSQLAIFPEQPEAFSELGTTGGAALREWDSGRWEILAPWADGQQVGGSFGHGFEVAPGGGYALAYGGLRGVGGSGDPTADPCAMSCESNVYIDDVTAGLSDTFPGEGMRSLVNVCTGTGPSRTTIPSVDGAGRLAAAPCPGSVNRPVSSRGASLPSLGSLRGQMSDDGSRVFFMSPSHLNATGSFDVASTEPCEGVGAVETECPPQLYVRQRNADGTIATRWISESAVGGQDASLLATAVFEGATPDGDKAFFRTASPLTADDPNGGVQVPGGVRSGTPSSSSVDLYMYDFPDAPGADPGDGALTRISAGPTGGADVNVSTNPVDSSTTSLRAFADDGSLVYFVTASRLPGVAAASGTITSPGGTPTQAAVRNLYLYDTTSPSDRRWRFVAQLPADTTFGNCAAIGSLPAQDPLLAGTNGTGLNGQVQLGESANCVRGTGDGSLVTFFTDGRLTSDDPDGVSGDMYAYDAGSDALMRISAPEVGAAGGSYVCLTDELSGAAVGARCHGDPRVSGLGTRRRRPLSVVASPGDPTDRAAAFFESASQLVPEDRNDVYDVYRWRNGHLALISTGDPGAEPALYQGNDRTGTNVYFSTRDRLTWQDHDAVLDVYTARVGGGIPEPAEPPICDVLAGRCRGGGAAPAALPAPQTTSPSPGAGDTAGEARRKLAVRRPSRRARRAAARSGVLRIVVRTNQAGRVTAVAKARLGKRTRRIARSTVRLRRAGKATLRLRLSRPARKRLRGGRALRVKVRVSSPGAKARAMTVRLPGVRR